MNRNEPSISVVSSVFQAVLALLVLVLTYFRWNASNTSPWLAATIFFFLLLIISVLFAFFYPLSPVGWKRALLPIVFGAALALLLVKLLIDPDITGGKEGTESKAGGTTKSPTPSIEITSPVPPETAKVKLLKGPGNKCEYRVAGNVSNVKIDEDSYVYVLTSDEYNNEYNDLGNPVTWWVYRAHTPANGRWVADVTSQYERGKEIDVIAVVADPGEIRKHISEKSKEEGITVGNPSDLNPEAMSKRVTTTMESE